MAEKTKVSCLQDKQTCKKNVAILQVPLKLNSKEGNIAFSFELPKNDLALDSVKVDSQGVPEFYFRASKNVPTLLDEDIAAVFRLVLENKYPEFFYLSFPPTHPLHKSRFFKYYSPTWLKGTSVGELLSESDWDMKCLSLGTETDEEKTVFKSRSRSSRLKGLATKVDFPVDKASASMIMSCESIRVQKGEDEIRFPEEPKMQIKAGTSLSYSEYITKHFQSIGLYDEPRFLKMQELIKLHHAVEWLCKVKGVQVNREWMMKCTNKTTSADAPLMLEARKKPPKKMIPQPPAFKQPDSDIHSWQVELLKPYFKRDARYGYHDHRSSAMITFKEDGMPCPPQKYLHWSVEYHTNTLPFEIKSLCHIPIKYQPAEFRDRLLQLLPKHSKKELKIQPADFSSDIEVDESADESGMEVRVTTTTKALETSHPLSLVPLQETLIVTANDGKQYKNEDPNQAIEMLMDDREATIIPKVKSWDELISEYTVPIPCMWLNQSDELGQPAAMGGVSTRDIRVQEEALPTRAAHKETLWKDGFKRSGHLLGVRGQHITAQGM